MSDLYIGPVPQQFGDLGDVDGSDTTAGHVPTRQADGTFAMDAPAAASDRVWMPLTTVVGGVPELVWDDNDSLIPTEVPT